MPSSPGDQWPLRKWQIKALAAWREGGRKGIVSAVTGGGKTVLALACIDRAPEQTVLIVVPTLPLLEQWWEEVTSYFGLALDDVHIVSGSKSMKQGTVNLAVINTASKLAETGRDRECFLIVDECHKAASPEFRAIFDIKYTASLGLSATPRRQYDDGLDEILIPKLGPILFEYSYVEARHDRVIVPFQLRNIVFELDDETRSQYDKLTRSIAGSINKNGADAQETVALYLRRSRVLNSAPARVELAIRILQKHAGEKAIIFHEDINSCNVIDEVLRAVGYRSGVYHSALKARQRVEMLAAYRASQIDVLVTCRALDEGFNVPEARIGIIAASTATRRQRIQRLGRVLRPSAGKDGAIIYTFVATEPEVQRLKEEENELGGVADVIWTKA